MPCGGRWSLLDQAEWLGWARCDVRSSPEAPHGLYEPIPGRAELVDYHGSLVELRGTAVLVGWCECDQCLEWGDPAWTRALLVAVDALGELRLLTRVRRCRFTWLSGPLARPVHWA